MIRFWFSEKQLKNLKAIAAKPPTQPTLKIHREISGTGVTKEGQFRANEAELTAARPLIEDYGGEKRKNDYHPWFSSSQGNDA